MSYPQTWLNATVVVDTDSRYTYVGTLLEIGEGFVRIGEAGVYDSASAKVPLDQHLDEWATYGVAVSRQEIWVIAAKIVSLSRLTDIIKPGTLSP